MESMDCLSQPEVEHFREQGFVIVEDLYSRKEMQDLKHHAIEMCLDSDTPEENVKWNALVESEEFNLKGKAKGLHSFWRPHTISNRFRVMCQDSRLTGRLASLLGPNVVTFNGLVIFKSREIGLPFPYHQDLWYFRKRNDMPITVAIWLAMDDAGEENGCLWVIPKSHEGPIFDHVEPEAEFTQQEFREVREAAEMDEVPVLLNAGSALFFHGALLHRSGNNRSSRDRTCWVIHNTSADSRFAAAKDSRSLEQRAIMKTRGSREPLYLERPL